MPTEKANTITPQTRIPIGWVFVGFVGISGSVLFLADIRSSARVNESNVRVLEKRVDILEKDLKTELRAIHAELRKLNSHKTK